MNSRRIMNPGLFVPFMFPPEFMGLRFMVSSNADSSGEAPFQEPGAKPLPAWPASPRAKVHATVARDWAVEDDTPYLNEAAYAPRFRASIRVQSLEVPPTHEPSGVNAPGYNRGM